MSQPMEIDEFCGVLKEQGLRSGAGVPCSVFKPLVNAMTVDPELDYLAASSEGEAVAISSGLIAAGRPAFSIMQNSGLGNAVNPLTSLVYIYRIPLSLFVSLRGEPGKPDEPQHLLMGQITADLARLCELRTETFEPASFQDSLASARKEEIAAAWVCRRGTLTGGPKASPIALKVETGRVEAGHRRIFSPQISREEALAQILDLLNQGLGGGGWAPAVISTTGKLSRELYELDDQEHDKENRFYMVGSMGCAAGFGLGVARGAPGRKVVVLDGDGALLMKLGTLATIGQLAPENLHHLVFDNGSYESTGAQPTASTVVDFAAAALACGYRDAETVDQPEELARVFSRHLSQPGPTLLRIVIRTGARSDLGRPRLAPRDGWERFCDFLQR